MNMYRSLLLAPAIFFLCIFANLNAMKSVITKTKYGNKQERLDNLPSWLLKTESKHNPDKTIRTQALQILIARGEEVSLSSPSTPSSCSTTQSTTSIASYSESPKN